MIALTFLPVPSPPPLSSPLPQAWQMLKRAGFTYHKLFNNRIAWHAFSETRLSPVLQLCRSHTSLVTCHEPKVAQLLRLQRKLPQLVVIGGWWAFVVWVEKRHWRIGVRRWSEKVGGCSLSCRALTSVSDML